MNNVACIERARELRLSQDTPYVNYARKVWDILGDQTELANDCLRDCYLEGASPEEAAEEIKGWH